MMNSVNSKKTILDHTKYMRVALNLASKGLGYTSPNPVVGAIIVKNGKIVGTGYHKKFGGNHAEIEAINKAGKHAQGATLYVTLEPCNHYGKTPPCTKEILRAKIKEVVFPIKDPNITVIGGGEKFLKKQGVKIISGICEKEALALNESFIKYTKTGLPFIIAKMAATLDGQIATSTGDSKWITGHKARQYVHKIRHSVDAIIVGKNTILTDNPRLTTRVNSKIGMDPARIILDTNLSIPCDSKIIVQESNAQTYIAVKKNIDKKKKEKFQKLGVKVIPLPLNVKNNRIDIPELVKTLGEMKFSSVLVEGGGEVMSSMLSSKVIDKVLFFYGPKILSGNDGVPMFRGHGSNLIKNAVAINNISIHKFGNDIMFQGYIDK